MQLSFSFTRPPGPRARLRAALARELHHPVEVVITDNRSSLLTSRPGREGLQVRLHRMFLEADDQVMTALGRFLAGQDRRAGQVVDSFIEAHLHLVARPRRPPRAAPRGRVHDLQAILDEIRRDLLPGAEPVDIAWSVPRRRRTRRARRSVVLGLYFAEDRLILLHPTLDRSFVPRFFVEWIVYHELLHHVLGAELKGRRRHVHTPAFRAAERRFPRYAEARAFEDRYLDRLLSF